MDIPHLANTLQSPRKQLQIPVPVAVQGHSRKHRNAKQSKAKQSKQSNAKQSKAKQSKAKQPNNSDYGLQFSEAFNDSNGK